MNYNKNLKQKIEYLLYEDDSFKATATKFALMAIALGGIAFAGALAPNIFRPFRKYGCSRRYSNKQIGNAVYNLRRQKLIEIVRKRNNRTQIKLTKKGKTRFRESSIESLSIPKPQKWDRRWRVVIFDIPVRLNNARHALREKIRELGFLQLQKSVWIHPYPCEDEILLIAGIFKVAPFVELLLVERLLHENRIRKFFNL